MVPPWRLLTLALLVAADAHAQPAEALEVYEQAWAAFDKNDHAQAIVLFEQAAGLGSAKAAHNLGSIYEEGKAAPPDQARALEWYRKGAELGSARSMHNLAVYHEKGQGGLKVDLAEAFKWYSKAAEGGLSNSQHQVGIFYAEGRGVAQDEAKAIEFLRLAADQGHDGAKKRVGELEREKAGGPVAVASPAPGGPDPAKLFEKGMALFKKPDLGAVERKKALRLIAAAASRGHLEAQFTLGVIFIKGKGVPASEVRGRTWLAKAAGKGHAKSKKVIQVLDARAKGR